jgi:hypothetical protein
VIQLITMWMEIRKLVVLIAGIGFMVVGIVLIVRQIQATGVIDVGTAAFKGKIESGSAGLFVCFFAFWLIVIPILTGKDVPGTTAEGNKLPASETAKRSTFALSPRHRRWLLGVVLVLAVDIVFLVWAIAAPGETAPLALTIMWTLCLVFPSPSPSS